eukprot:5718195-Prymnesium_polylepis.1
MRLTQQHCTVERVNEDTRFLRPRPRCEQQVAGQSDKVEVEADAAADGGENNRERDRDARARGEHAVEQRVR